ncbi:Ca-activated chloride channel homolog [uncultured Thiomicrorhabdus sp.]
MNAELSWLLDWWQSWQFAEPQFLWLALLLPVWWLYALFKPSSDLLDWQDWHFAKLLSARHSLLAQMQSDKSSASATTKEKGRLTAWQIGLLQILRTVILLSLVAALAQPQSPLPPEPQAQQKTVRDLLFVVESSASFLLNDYQQNGQPQTRMDAVKQVLDQFMRELPGNRFAITVYAESAFNLMSLSADQRAARLYLQRLRPYLAGRTDEAMAEALGLALKQTQQGSLLMKHPEQRKRLLILISDGDNQPSRLPVQQAIDYAQLLQVPIYTIGVGSTSKSADQRQRTGLLYQPLKADLLQTIAEQTGGAFYQIGSGEELQGVLEQIDQAEGVPWQAPPQQSAYQPIYWQFLQLSAVLFVLYLTFMVAFRPQETEE